MNEWVISYLYNGAKVKIVSADTILLAITKFLQENPEVPSLALYEVRCTK